MIASSSVFGRNRPAFASRAVRSTDEAEEDSDDYSTADVSTLDTNDGKRQIFHCHSPV